MQMTGTRIAVLLACAALAAPARSAPDLPLPDGAVMTVERIEAPGSGAIPTGPWAAGAVPMTIAEGTVTQRAWRVPDGGPTTLALLAPLRDSLAALGYRPILACDAPRCGGFDFRFALEIAPEPAMHVDLGDFRFLSAVRDGPEGTDHVALLVSRSARAGFVHMVHVGSAAPGPDTAVSLASKSPGDTDLAARLAAGPLALDGLAFPPNGATLAPGPTPLLDRIGALLAANPDLRVTVIGHTDASGDAAANRALSERRAAAVRDRLVAVPGVDPAQVAAMGAGQDRPRASNATPEGRAENRRVEVTITPLPVQAP
ncbi:MAG: OmpA family protein [Gemmobacter sp.]